MSTNILHHDPLPIVEQKSPQSSSIANLLVKVSASIVVHHYSPPVSIVNFNTSKILHLAQLFVVKREHTRVFAIQLHLLITLLKIMLIKIIMIS